MAGTPVEFWAAFDAWHEANTVKPPAMTADEFEDMKAKFPDSYKAKGKPTSDLREIRLRMNQATGIAQSK